MISAKPNPNTLINRNPSNYNTKLFDNGWRLKQAIILTEFNQGLDMQFLNQSLGFLALMIKEVRTMNF
ncbi:hypothetical protein [Helicobacter pylori]|uniref:hypothetical protein n=1 Tax=Helicobacter pylori TaxID=210 RepID=UPI001F0C52DC|nr:hypothetical protein [Helicobacter pylori]